MPSYLYRDLKLSSSPHPETGDIRPVNDVEAIKNSLRNLLNSRRGDRPFQPLLGGTIYDFLFENINRITTEVFRRNIIDMLNTYEPRVIVDLVNISTDGDKNSMSVSMSFTIVETGNIAELTIVLERLR